MFRRQVSATGGEARRRLSRVSVRAVAVVGLVETAARMAGQPERRTANIAEPRSIGVASATFIADEHRCLAPDFLLSTKHLSAKPERAPMSLI